MSGRDWLTHAGAIELAGRIEAYWAKRGKTVRCEVFATAGTDNHGKTTYSIRSDLVLLAPERAP